MDKTKNENALAGLQPLRGRLDMAAQRSPDDAERLEAVSDAHELLDAAEEMAKVALYGGEVPQWAQEARDRRREESMEPQWAPEGDDNGPQEHESTPQDGDGEVSGESSGGAAPELNAEGVPREYAVAPESVSEESSEAGAGEERPE